jgi:hypothetical protein
VSIREHLITRHEFDEDAQGLVGTLEDLHAMHRDVHDDERMDGEQDHQPSDI